MSYKKIINQLRDPYSFMSFDCCAKHPTTLTSKQYSIQEGMIDKMQIYKNQNNSSNGKEKLLEKKKSISTIIQKKKIHQQQSLKHESRKTSLHLSKRDKTSTLNSFKGIAAKNSSFHLKQNNNLKRISKCHTESDHQQIYLKKMETFDTIDSNFQKENCKLPKYKPIQLNPYNFDHYDTQESYMNQNNQSNKGKQFNIHYNNSYQNSKTFQEKQENFNFNVSFIENQYQPNKNKIKLFNKVDSKDNLNLNSSNYQINHINSMIFLFKTSKNQPSPQNQQPFQQQLGYFGKGQKTAQSRYIQNSKLIRSKKKFLRTQMKLQSYETITVNSDYDELFGHEQKIEQSKILVNFFNPSSHIRDRMLQSQQRKC